MFKFIIKLYFTLCIFDASVYALMADPKFLGTLAGLGICYWGIKKMWFSKKEGAENAFEKRMLLKVRGFLNLA